ncbi:MAG: hypothetical protein M3680_00215 [Myxococcota bacterium]|nr:hypothetical protein [Myxococcota bacterium]
MSELAFNANGESFEVPATVTGWRVRRMKPRGAPELVYGRDGRPLTIPVESDLDDLRESVGLVGKYRLDPINDDGKAVENVPAAYIQVVRPERTEAPPSVAASASGTSDDTIREAMRMNTELAKAVIDRFPEMMQAAAVLLRAADGAGLPARPPLATETDDDDDTDEHAEAVPQGFDLNALVAQVVPLIVMSLGKGKLKVPDLGAVLDWRKASPHKQITDHEATAPSAKADSPIELPPLDPATMAHFIAVQSALKADEAAFAREVAGDLEPAALRSWFDELSKLSVPAAVVKIRALIGKGGAS